VIALYREGVQGGVSTGFPSIDQHYTVRPGEMTIVTGIPSHGKSQFLDALAVNLAHAHDWTIAVCSPENLPASRHLAKLAEQYTGKPLREGTSPRVTMHELIEAVGWLDSHFVFIAPEDALTIPALLKQSKALVTRHGIRGLILDPWNEFEHTRPHGKRRPSTSPPLSVRFDASAEHMACTSGWWLIRKSSTAKKTAAIPCPLPTISADRRTGATSR